ncbi:hypothetical protein D9M68_648180 [compost metagenome]
MRDAAAVEQPPILARHARLVADGQRDQHRRVAVLAQGRAQTLPDMVARAFDRHARRCPRPVGQQPGLPPHRSHRAHASREVAALRIRAGGVQQPVRTPQHQRHPPDLPGHQHRHPALRARRHLPGDLEPGRDARPGGFVQFSHEALPARVAIRQFGDAQHKPGYGIVVLVRQRIVQPPLRL